MATKRPQITSKTGAIVHFENISKLKPDTWARMEVRNTSRVEFGLMYVNSSELRCPLLWYWCSDPPYNTYHVYESNVSGTDLWIGQHAHERPSEYQDRVGTFYLNTSVRVARKVTMVSEINQYTNEGKSELKEFLFGGAENRVIAVGKDMVSLYWGPDSDAWPLAYDNNNSMLMVWINMLIEMTNREFSENADSMMKLLLEVGYPSITNQDIACAIAAFMSKSIISSKGYEQWKRCIVSGEYTPAEIETCETNIPARRFQQKLLLLKKQCENILKCREDISQCDVSPLVQLKSRQLDTENITISDLICKASVMGDPEIVYTILEDTFKLANTMPNCWIWNDGFQNLSKAVNAELVSHEPDQDPIDLSSISWVFKVHDYQRFLTKDDDDHYTICVDEKKYSLKKHHIVLLRALILIKKTYIEYNGGLDLCY